MQTSNTFSVVLFTRKSRSKQQELSIYARITVNGKRSEISLKRHVQQKEWDASKNRRGCSYPIQTLNRYLDQEYSRLLDCYKQLLEEDKVVSSQAIKSSYLGEENTQKTLNELLVYHNTNMVNVLKSGTMKNYYTTEKYLHKFLKQKQKAKDIYLKQLNYRFIIDFEQYLRKKPFHTLWRITRKSNSDICL